MRILFLALVLAGCAKPVTVSTLGVTSEAQRCDAQRDRAACERVAAAYDGKCSWSDRACMDPYIHYQARACQKGNLERCRHVHSEIARNMRSTDPETHELAMAVMRTLCGSDDPKDREKGCGAITSFYDNGGPPPPVAGDVDAVVRDCREVKNFRACGLAGAWKQKGTGTDKDPAAAVELFSLACDGTRYPLPWACAAAAAAYAKGDGVPVQVERAEHYYEYACLNAPDSYCDAYADFMATRCDGGDAARCFHLGEKLVDRDPVRARALIDRGCKSGDAEACAYLKHWEGTGR